jgi:CHASE2 domain-containing sensor protein
VKSFEDGIVIIGATHQWADDLHTTPIGELPGAIVHANIALELQSLPAREVPLSIQFGLDSLLIVISAIAAVPLCWYPVFKSTHGHGRLPINVRLSRMARECLVVVMFGLAFGGVVVILANLYGDFVSGWRFGFISFCLGAVLVLLIEFIALIADATAEFVEVVALRHFRCDSRELGGEHDGG